jgi:hypothetical protein
MKNSNYWLGYIITLFTALVLTPIYLVCITILRTFIFLWDILYDTATFLPKALFEYDKSFQKRYWQDEMDRINKLFDKNKKD